MSEIGERMKTNYEHRSRYYLTRRVPVIIRVDGRAFHTLTAQMQRPFDENFVAAMVHAAKAVFGQMQGVKAAYVQSDEASFFLTDYDTLKTEAWFGYNKSKIETISASLMSVNFCSSIGKSLGRAMVAAMQPCFDARSFNIPRGEVVNYFLWRSKDWARNSLSMYCRSYFTDAQLRKKDRNAQHELLKTKGKNWATDLPDVYKNGTWILGDDRTRTDILPNYSQINEIISSLVNCDAGPVDEDSSE